MNHEIDNLYSLYRFTKLSEKETCIVYLHESGYFSNVEIFETDKDSPKNDKIRKEYEHAGHSVKKVHYSNFEEAHEALFKGFFRIKETKKRLKREYDEYCKSQTKQLGAVENTGEKYEYVKGSFFKNGKSSDDDIINTIFQELTVENSKLIILEAAAGYGKTCTTYEVLNMLLDSDKEDKSIPLLAELSKNRKATIFRYVLQDEIDNSFTGIKYETVIHEIKLGNIPVIIDGFDELLSKTLEDSDEMVNSANEEAQTMLDTIAQLFDAGSKTKVLLTSRKSSIFAGETFDKWVEEKLNNCDILRLQLSEPTIRDWIGYEKEQLLENKGISLEVIPNPVLLSFLKSRSIEELTEKYKTAEDILKSYFELLLTREVERNQILLPWQEQYDIMVLLAAQFVKYDISSDDAATIQDLFSLLLSEKINDYLKQYDSFSKITTEIRPQNEEEFLNKFVHHALLDRISFSSNKIGFINDFVFGIMIGEAVIRKELSAEDMLSEKYIDICTTAFSLKNQIDRRELFDKLKNAIQCLNEQQQLNTDIVLLNSLSHNYQEQSFELVQFKKNIDLSSRTFTNCTFHSCIFSGCKIPSSLFYNCQFFDCKFYDIEVICNTTDNRNLSFWSNSEGYEGLAEAGAYVKETAIPDINYKKKVLEQYIKPGYDKAELHKVRATLYRGFADTERENIDCAIDELIKEGVLIQMLRVIKLNIKKMTEITNIIGR